MSPHTSASEVPKEPAQRRAWIIYQLRVRGLSLTSLARDEGISIHTVARTLGMPNSHVEPVLAKALGLTAQQLFPERFDAATGRRLHTTRPPQRSTAPKAGNVKAGQAA